MDVAEAVQNMGLIIAFGDAQARCKVELERAQERESSERTKHGHSLEEDARLLTLLRRSDALNGARTMIIDHVAETAYAEGARQEILSRLDELHDEASRVFQHYKRELGTETA